MDEARRRFGLPPLAWNETLAALAREHSASMARGEVAFGHDGFEARVSRAAETLQLRRAAENIYRTTQLGADLAEAALARWLDSDVHRRNLKGEFDVTGVGIAAGRGGELFVTQLFVASRAETASE